MNRLHTAVMESLATRRLMSVALSGEQIHVTGTPGNDHIMITRDAAGEDLLRVNLNGEWFDYARTDVSGVLVIGGAGRDHIIVDEANGDINTPMTLMGNGGADLLIGSSGDDEIYGGGGRDRIVGAGGNDTIFGGGSRDQIAGGDGADVLIGNSGDDALDGGAGNDEILGGNGDDYSDAGAGDDTVTGGRDYDSLIGGLGEDQLAGGRGDDDIDGGNGTDLVTGGAGSDAFAGDDESDTIVDQTSGDDRVYTRVSMDFIPQQYHAIFAMTFPNSEPIGVRVNDDQTFVLLYRYNGDGTVYRAYFTYEGENPFSMEDGVDLITYEVAPSNLGPLSKAAFEGQYGEGHVIKSVFADRDENGDKWAVIRYVGSDGQVRVGRVGWLDHENEDV